GDVRLSNVTGTLTIGGTTTTAAGNIVLSSGDAVAVNAPLGDAGTTGTITIAANTDGGGTQGYSQSAAGNLQTGNTTTGAVAITDDTAGAASATLSAGTGGLYLTDWGGLDLTIASANATGAGTIQLIAGNAGNQGLWVTGPVHTDTGSIFLAADDDLFLAAG